MKIGKEGKYEKLKYKEKEKKIVGLEVEIGEEIEGKISVKKELVEGKWDGIIEGIEEKR